MHRQFPQNIFVAAAKVIPQQIRFASESYSRFAHKNEACLSIVNATRSQSARAIFCTTHIAITRQSFTQNADVRTWRKSAAQDSTVPCLVLTAKRQSQKCRSRTPPLRLSAVYAGLVQCAAAKAPFVSARFYNIKKWPC